jgi:RNA polymerase-binding transcription factor DksA
MEANLKKLYSELRKTKKELVDRLENRSCSSKIQLLISDELHDVDWAISKINAGTYGTCELSGELIPMEILEVIPTLKSIREVEEMGEFCRKSIY